METRSHFDVQRMYDDKNIIYIPHKVISNHLLTFKNCSLSLKKLECSLKLFSIHLYWNLFTELTCTVILCTKLSTIQNEFKHTCSNKSFDGFLDACGCETPPLVLTFSKHPSYVHDTTFVLLIHLFYALLVLFKCFSFVLYSFDYFSASIQSIFCWISSWVSANSSYVFSLFLCTQDCQSIVFFLFLSKF